MGCRSSKATSPVSSDQQRKPSSPTATTPIIINVSSPASATSATGAASGASPTTTSQPTALSPQEFRPFTLSAITVVSSNTKRYTLAFPDPSAMSGVNVASCIVIRAPPPKPDADPIIRPYTPISPEVQTGSMELVIKSYAQGNVSKYMDSLSVGDTVEVTGPFPKISVTPNEVSHIGMVAGGTGITPMLQVARHLLTASPEDKTRLTLLFANSTPADVLMKEEIDALAAAHERFTVVYTVSRGFGEDWNGLTRRVDREMLADTMPGPTTSCKVFTCGPPSFMQTISGDKQPDKSQGPLTGLLKDMGYTQDQVYKF